MGTAIQAKLDAILRDSNDSRVLQDDLNVFDKGLFLAELKRQGVAFSTDNNGNVDGSLVANRGLRTGTYKGTKLAALELYKLYDDAMGSSYNSQGYETIFPTERSLQQKRDLYQWSNPATDHYPPHLLTLPAGQPSPLEIFNVKELLFVQSIAKAMSYIIPDDIAHEGTPYIGPSLADTEAYNRDPTNRSPATDIMNGHNIGELADWYSDRRFAQQQLSGVNPCTIELAPRDTITKFAAEAGKQGLTEMQGRLAQGKDIYMQDYSFFREATGYTNGEEFVNHVPNFDPRYPDAKVYRYASAPIGLFQLHDDGRLHPLAITIDYKGSLDKSVTIFNKRLDPDSKAAVPEKDDWPWRYAKTVLQAADWARHEIAVHLVDTHMIEEAVIVATNRTVPDDHLLYELLSPHWFRTLSLNQSARSVLVPAVINRIGGFGPQWQPPVEGVPLADSNAYKLIRYAYDHFDFQGKYVPNDLKKRGFDVEAEQHTDKLRNYPYAANMFVLWGVLRDFVKTVLSIKYTSDHHVQQDPVIANWAKEIQVGGQVKTFPTITTLDQLIDACTMCIHIASPQHTAINYLQNYYYNYVPSKPPALCTPLPKDLRTLQALTEKDLTTALPIGSTDAKWKDWLLAAQLPELLSFRVEDQYNLLTYAKTLHDINVKRSPGEAKKFGSDVLAQAGAQLYGRLISLKALFEANSAFQTPGTVEYKVMNPDTTAVSILL
ncbi:lipoxygenase 1 [Microdochium trichocladiopsis]|uniref:Manganese lipoxygenase n=1 Tax=Microdochium trichocladiopsis TaxID=1682393 RepID=A0A9P8XW02_9PEZI|nr:lipoxygenase 1 [Microdochium trichocladiopsis]KAH7018034.1 lipoxygenase 1 [Microdochium trichocladiopsis]